MSAMGWLRSFSGRPRSARSGPSVHIAMKNKFVLILLVFGAAEPGWCKSASLQDKACEHAIRSVKKFVAPAKHKDEYYCSLHAQSAGYFVFRMNARYPAPPDSGPDWVGSNLMGYVAVSRNNGKVYNWDIGNERVGEELKPMTRTSP